MALLPLPLTKPAKGLPGQFQDMEEWNAFTAFVTGTATKAIGFGHPVSRNGQAGDGTVSIRALLPRRFLQVLPASISPTAATCSLWRMPTVTV